MSPFYDIYILNGRLSFTNADFYGIDYSMFDQVRDVNAFSWRNGKPFGLNMEYFVSFTRNELQVFNQWIFNTSFIGILISLLLFVYFSQKRKRYYLTNFISFLIVLAFDFYLGFSLLFKTGEAQLITGQARYDIINASQSVINLDETLVNYYSAETFNWIFTVGYILAGVIIGVAVIGLVLLVLKFISQRKEKAVDTSEVVIHE
jgi:predicted membrane protein